MWDWHWRRSLRAESVEPGAVWPNFHSPALYPRSTFILNSALRELGRKAQVWYRDNLVGTVVVNAETGWTIGFQTRGAKKIGGRKGPDLYRIVPTLKDILEKGNGPERSRTRRVGKIGRRCGIPSRRASFWMGPKRM